MTLSSVQRRVNFTMGAISVSVMILDTTTRIGNEGTRGGKKKRREMLCEVLLPEKQGPDCVVTAATLRAQPTPHNREQTDLGHAWCER